MTLVRAAQLDISPCEWTVDGIIPRVGVGFAHGPSNIGKSLVFGPELALAVANKRPFFDHNVIQGTVVYALGEALLDAGVRKEARLIREERDRFTAATNLEAHPDQTASEYLASLPPYTDENLFIETRPFIIPLGSGNEPTMSLKRAVTAMSALPSLELIIIDPMANFSGTLSISNDASANRFLMGAQWMATELDTTVLLIAHDTQDGKKMIGAGRLYNGADYSIAIKPEDGTAAGEIRATITCDKPKYGPPFEPISYVGELVPWDAPLRDENGELTGETEPVVTPTVRLAKMDDLNSLSLNGSGTCQKRKRTGLLSPEQMAQRITVGPTQLITDRLAKPCNECGAPASRSCNPLPGSQYTTIAPGIDVHESRALTIATT